jgi:hypothetical protein
MPDPSAPPVEILERAGDLVRVAHFDGWLAAKNLGPCGSCGGRVFQVVTGRVAEREIRSLRCVACLPPKKGEWAGRRMMMPGKGEENRGKTKE